MIAEGKYGVDAEELVTVDVPIMPRRAVGTDIAGMLIERKYKGP